MASRVSRIRTALSVTKTKPGPIWRAWLKVARSHPRAWLS